jgi:alanine racemase
VEAYATLDTRALAHNLNVARTRAPGCRLMAVVKADGYGHGLETVAYALSAADGFAVARFSEALRLREAGLAHPILLLEGVFGAEELAAAVRHHLDVVVHTLAQVQLLESYQRKGRVNVWLKVDTGMSRLGIAADQWHDCAQRLSRCAMVARPIRAMTHFACADDQGSDSTAAQIAAFGRLVADTGHDISLANSAGVLLWPESLKVPAQGNNWIRPGLMLYGVSPTSQSTAAACGLKPALRLASRIIAVKDLKQGDTVGYGAQWRAERNSVIAVVAAGYGDGYPWTGTELPALVNGQRVPVVGRVSMDMLTVDVSDIERPQIGDEVVLFGDDLPVEEVAAAAGTIPYTLLCGVTQRVRREVI